MFERLRRFLFGDSLRTRMTEEQVRLMADWVAHKAHIDGGFARVSVRRIEGRIVWVATTATIGSGWSVTIDDATGEVGPVKRWGFR
jgi:hypothetical protein